MRLLESIVFILTFTSHPSENTRECFCVYFCLLLFFVYSTTLKFIIILLFYSLNNIFDNFLCCLCHVYRNSDIESEEQVYSHWRFYCLCRRKRTEAEKFSLKTFIWKTEGCFMFSRTQGNPLTPPPPPIQSFFPHFVSIRGEVSSLPTGDARYFWNKWVNTSSKQD